MFKELGHLMALDILVNNSDRFPLIWGHQGNFSNIMISENGHIYSIDSKITPIDEKSPMHNQYLKKVKDVVAAVRGGVEYETMQFRTVRECITNHLGFDIGKEGSVEAQKGFLETVSLAANSDLPKDLKSYTATIQKQFGNLRDVNLLGNSIKFVTLTWEAVKEGLSQKEEETSDKGSTVIKRADDKLEECSWRKVNVTSQKPFPRRYPSGFMVGRKFYVWAGFGANKKAYNDLYVFDLDNKTWNLVGCGGKVPPERYGHSGTLVDGKLWVFGGSNDAHLPKDDLYYLDLANMQWTEVTKEGNWPPPRFHHSAALTEDGSKIYIFGGSKTQSDHLNDMWELSLETKTWTRVPTEKPPVPRAGHLSFFYKNVLWVFGGYNGKAGADKLTDTHKLNFNDVSVLWEESESMGSIPQTHRSISHVYDGQGLIYVFGGYDGKAPVGLFYQLVIETGKWRHIKLALELEAHSIGSAASGSMGTIPTPRYGHVMGLDNQGVITVFGGSGSMYLNDVFQILTVEEEDD